MRLTITFLFCLSLSLIFGCQTEEKIPESKAPNEILGNPDYQAISYGGYRAKTRDVQPTNEELKEDLKILSAMGIRILRTYNVQLAQTPNLLKAISELKQEDPSFEMYVMMGAWIDCLNAWSDLPPDHTQESPQNEGEIGRAVALAKQYPDIVKAIAVGNEAMVRWAESYYVQPAVILKWVTYLQDLKAKGELPKDLWITSSDDFSSWGGGDSSYHTPELAALYEAVDFVSMHTYPYHNTHYNPDFWRDSQADSIKSDEERIKNAMIRARDFARSQYDSVKNYMATLGIKKPLHIGETGWATISDGFYGPKGSRATDEFKQGLYYDLMREWTNEERITCFYFEAFDEQWKDSQNPNGSENHFGLIDLNGHAKYPLWDEVDAGIFNGLTRNGNPIIKSFDGNLDELKKSILPPPIKNAENER
ncbi:glycosyl hydrolase family 17 [Algoriphagus namhaensis]|uniref:Endo-1,3-beta-glucanase btgC n=1 Tax=Algoriphagus namhaensis TaxID=915353 RepID=A0ABV8AT02_9BACT